MSLNLGASMSARSQLELEQRALEPSVVLRWITSSLVVLVFLLISLGGLVRNAGAGLSCPDWPLCFGKVVPPMDVRVFLEWFHRLIAGSASVALVVVSGWVFWDPVLRPRLAKYCITALALLSAQIILGGMTVLGLLAPKWVSSHLVVGVLFFGTLLLLSLEVRDFSRNRVSLGAEQGLGRVAMVISGLALGQILLGGFVSSNYAALVCEGFPKCNGAWIPPLEGLVAIQFFHRLLALVVAVSIAALAAVVWRRPLSSRARFAVGALPLLLVGQFALGIGMVLFNLPLPLSVAHLATGAAMFGALLVVTYELRRS